MPEPLTITLVTTHSTQDEARLRFESNHQTVWVRAIEQIAGRGRHGRMWVSRPGDLVVSTALRWPPGVTHKTFLPLIAGHALRQALRDLAEVPRSVFLKWPNDLFWLPTGAPPVKLAGVIAESVGREGAVVGWGVNLVAGERTIEAAYGACSCAEACGTVIAPGALLTALQARFGEYLLDWAANPEAFEVTFTEKLRHESMAPLWGLVGTLSVDGSRAKALDLDSLGELIVEIVEGPRAGERRAVMSGEFSFFKK